MQYQEKELFQSYEIKNWNFSPRLYKIFGAAAIFNLFFLFVVVQANVFTTRGCDSPLVGSFCQVLDTIYLGSALLDANGDFVSRDYQKTELADADITFVDVSGATPPLTYPEGYFALANPERAMMPMPEINGNFPMMPPPNMNGFPGIPSNPTTINGNDFLSKPQVTPTPNKNVIAGNLDDSPFTIEGTAVGENPIPAPNPTYRPPVNRRPPFGKVKGKNAALKPPMPEIEKTAEKKPDENQPPLNTAAVAEFKPNKKPLEDFAADIVAKRADKDKKLDLTKSFTVKMVGELDKDGKLDAKKSRYIKLKPEEQGDEEMVNVAKAAIEAINNGGLFYYLKQLGVDKVEFTLVQDDKQIYAVISSSQKTEERAKTISSGLTGLLAIAKIQVKEAELKTLIESAKVEPSGKNFVLKFKIDKPVAQEMINRKLQEAEAKKKAEEQSGKPNSTAQTVNTNQQTAK
ncbi:MAG: hypothetical protein LH472_13875 [Pyrinomonadaceae bacterium]|nr:hypothetical protein [Pyrinomonadaceae bacterium]